MIRKKKQRRNKYIGVAEVLISATLFYSKDTYDYIIYS